MFHSQFEEYHKLNHKIDENSPELRFLNHICEGKNNVTEFFHEKTANQNDVVIYTPGGIYSGIEEIKEFAKNFLKSLNATKIEVHPVIQTQA